MAVCSVEDMEDEIVFCLDEASVAVSLCMDALAVEAVAVSLCMEALAVAAEEELVAAVLISEADLAALATTSACQEPPPVLPEVTSAGATLEDLAYRFLNSSASYRRPCSHDLAIKNKHNDNF